MSRTTEAPQQHKQPSRKGKKAWRKNVDISEVQTGLEHLREEIIQGGPVSEKPSSELFTFDPSGSEAIQKAYNKVHKPLKAEEILAQRSAIPIVDGRKRASSSRVTDGIVEPSNKRQKGNWVSKKEVQRLKQVAARNGNNALSSEQLDQLDVDGAAFDLWESNTTPEDSIMSEYIPKPKPKVAPATLRQKPISMTADGRSTTSVPNPKAGTSYNPSFEDWDELLTEEGRRAVEAEQERIESERKAAELQQRVDAAGQDPGSGDEYDDESAWEGIESEHESTTYLRKKRPERKTPTQRNKAKRRKEAERQAKHAQRTSVRLKREMASQLNTLTGQSLAAELEKAAVQTGDIAVEDVDTNRPLRRRKLGTTAIPEKPLELILPDELQDSLRRLRPEGNLLNDRFRNLLVQGKLEARKPILHPKKKRVKITEKWTHKDFELAV